MLGKIAQLPGPIQEEINLRLQNGEEFKTSRPRQTPLDELVTHHGDFVRLASPQGYKSVELRELSQRDNRQSIQRAQQLAGTEWLLQIYRAQLRRLMT